jgi:NADPH:quinone reductase
VPLFAVGRPTGGYAESISVSATDVIAIPDGLSFEHAAALLVQGLTAVLLMRQTSMQGKTIAVTAAAGGVGSLLIQLAKCAGAKRVMALAGTLKKLELTQSLGADLTFNYQNQAWIDRVKQATGGKGIDIIYESVGGAITRGCINALALGRKTLVGRGSRTTERDREAARWPLAEQRCYAVKRADLSDIACFGRKCVPMIRWRRRSHVLSVTARRA